MPKVRNTATSGTHQGCKVWGFYRMADGSPMRETITVTPARAGIWQGVVYDATPVIIVPDKEGRYEAVLPPSSALGDYVVTAGRQQLRLRVPDDLATAALTALLVED